VTSRFLENPHTSIRASCQVHYADNINIKSDNKVKKVIPVQTIKVHRGVGGEIHSSLTWSLEGRGQLNNPSASAPP